MKTNVSKEWLERRFAAEESQEPEPAAIEGLIARRSAAACSRKDVPRTMAFHARCKGTPLERYWSAIGELEKSETILRKLRNALDDFKGHGMPGFRDRAEAIVIMQMVDEFLSENVERTHR